MPRRITGLETEYGCLVEPPLQASDLLPAIRDWLFERHRYGLIDRHDRDWDEPAGNGGFLFNGGRVYIDMGHLEYCTPECTTATEVVRYDRAGDLILLEAIRELGLDDRVNLIRNNVDHYTGATFGCHENYSLDRKARLSEKNVLSLLAFLTLRVLYTGSGRVGAIRPTRFRGEMVMREDPALYQISQRADYIQNDFFEWVQHNRAIINTRDEPLADPRFFRRLHLIYGDSNVLPRALFLKVGTTRLVLDLLDGDGLPAIALQDAVSSLRVLSRNLRPPWCVVVASGKSTDALELLEEYYRATRRAFRGRDEETDRLLALWQEVIEGLGTDPIRLVGTLDWVTKEYLFREFCEAEGVRWGDPWLESQDLEFHQVHPKRSLGVPLAACDGLWDSAALRHCMMQPPPHSRAHLRSRLMREIVEKKCSYFLDWDVVELDNDRRIRMLNPFQS